MKYTDEKWDSFWLAHLLRLGLLAQGYIYPKQERPIRYMLRRRMMFIRQRTTQILSFQSMIARHRGLSFSASSIKAFEDKFVEKMFDEMNLVFIGKSHMATIRHLSQVIEQIEAQASSKVTIRDVFKILRTTPGIGLILGLTIMLEVGDISRFEKVGNYSSYCRCVDSKRVSNGKKKGQGNKKNGNRYLSWAYIEAAYHAIRCNKHAQRFFQTKMAVFLNGGVFS